MKAAPANSASDPKPAFKSPVQKWLQHHIAYVQLVWIVVCLPALIFFEQVPLTWSLASLLGLALVPCLGWASRQRPLPQTPLDLSIALMLLLLPLNLGLSINRVATLPHIYKTIAGVVLFYGLVGFLQASGWYHWSALGICALGLALIPVVFLGTEWSGSKFSWLPWHPATLFPQVLRPFWKPEGFAGFNSNLMGGILAMLLPMPLAYTWFSRRLGVRLLAGLEVAALSVALLLTQSRGAMLAVLIAVMVMLGAPNWRRLLVLALLAAIGGWLWFHTETLGPIAPFDVDVDVVRALNSFEGRVELWSRALYMIQDFPLTGIGMGLVAEVLPRLYPTFLIPPTVKIEHLHNLYLNTGAELGIPGLLSLLAILSGILGLSWRAVQRCQNLVLQPLVRAGLGIIMVICVHGLSDAVTYYVRTHVIAWALLAVVTATSSCGLRFATFPKDAD